ncbi:hypothetical protein A3K64_02895 [Candidatus Micrarchaeota archaeon RBG_16_36_9]|nr:MAG: hypothetical protein A3K64_02895 [Candidatus Micrarchaeota archaeon RBG_16_36_9]
MSIEEHDLIAVPNEEYVIKHENSGPAIMKKYEGGWFPFSRTHLEEVRYHSKKLNLGQGMKVLGYAVTVRSLISDIPMLPFTAFYKLKDRISRK